MRVISETAPDRHERGHARSSLSVVCMTAGPGPRVAAILELLRPTATEIIVALDDRAEEEVFADVAAVADRVIEYPFLQPVDRPLPWLFDQCRGDWMLTIDDDEVPSIELLDVLPALCANDDVVHYSFARRWVYPTTASYLDDAPWRPDYQLRLFRTDPRLIRFSDALHRPIIPKGPGAFVPEPLWHLDTILRTGDQRRAKAHEYEVQRPGLRAGGRALNFGFYTPEARPNARVAPLADNERALVERVLGAGRPVGGTRAVLESVERGQIDAAWPERHAPQSGTLQIAESPRSFGAGEQGTVDVHVTNTGDATWQWGRHGVPAVRCASWWAGEERTDAVWTPLPSPVRPGGSVLVPVHVHAPNAPGTHVLLIDLVHEGVRWFGCDVSRPIDVRRRRRIGFYGADERTVRDVLAVDPDLEPLLFTHEPRSDREGYPEAPTPWRFLVGDRWSRVRMVLRAAAVLMQRDGNEFMEALASCERLVVPAPPAGEPRREAWCRSVVLLAARMLRVPVQKG